MLNAHKTVAMAMAAVAMLLALPTHVCAQSDAKATVAALDSVIKHYGNYWRQMNPYVEQVFKKHRDNPAVAVGIARAYYSYEVVRSHDPFKQLSANILYHNRDSANSLKYIAKALEIDPNYVPAMVQAGNLYFREGDTIQAFDWYRRAINASPRDSRGYVAYAETATLLGRRDDALGILRQMQQANPDAPAYRHMGRVYYSKGEAHSAAECYDHVALDSMDQYDLIAYSFSSFFSDSTARVRRSLEAVEYALKKYPRSATFTRLGLYDCHATRQYEQALVYGDKLFASTDNFEPRLDDYTRYADSHAALGNYDSAIDMLYSAINSPDATDHLREQCMDRIMAYHQQSGNYDRAIAMQRDRVRQLESQGKPVDKAYSILYNMCLSRAVADSANVSSQEAAYMEADAVLAEMEQKLPSSRLPQTLYERFRIASRVSELHPELPMEERYATTLQRAKNTFNYVAALPSPTDLDLQFMKATFNYLAYYYTQMDRNVRILRPFAEKMYRQDPTNSTAKALLGK